MDRTIYRVPEMHCGGCEAGIRKSLARLEGLGPVAVDLAARTVAVDHPAAVSREQVLARIQAAGFDAVELSAVG